MMTKTFVFVWTLVVAGFACAVEGNRFSFEPLSPSAQPVERVYLWPEGRMPYFQSHQVAEKSAVVDSKGFDREANRLPFIEWYEPASSNKTRTCILVLSGGGYETCCDARRLQPAIDRFVRAGLTVANLTYRTPRPKGLPIYQSSWADAQRAVRIIRAQAGRRGLDPDRIGATGISAGAKTVLLLALSSQTPAYERVDALDDLPCRLAFAIPQAPAYVLTDGATGANSNGGEGADIVPELKFDTDMAPLCCLQGGADVYSPLGSVRLYQRLRKMGVPAELHLFADRWHGFHGDANRAENGTAWDHWCELMLEFVSMFEQKTVISVPRSIDEAYPELERRLAAFGIPSVLVCGCDETERMEKYPELWLERRRHGVQSDLHLYARKVNDHVRSLRLVEFANHRQVHIAGLETRPVPKVAQLKRIREGVEIYGIVHWGLNTYTDREWGFGDENPADLNPVKFDADQIVGACKAGGLQGLIVVAKHHDGFCLWPTKTTEHNISKSPFRDGKGDYVKEMERACRKFGLKFGVYVSPWDRNNALYGTEKYVTDVFQAQIRELLSGDYGEIFEMWFDGANGGDGYYGGAREKRKIPSGYYRYETETFAMVRKLQPNVCIFNESDLADFRFGGNERGIVDPDSRSTGGHYDGVWDNYKQWANTGIADGTTFHPIEADFPLRPGWFYHAKERGKTKNAAYLMQRYLATVGNAATLNLGIAPNKDGLLDEEDVRALKGFGDLQRLFFAHPAKDGEPFNVIVMAEDVSAGERVDAWKLMSDGTELLSGRSIGIKRIRVIDAPVTADAVAVKVTSTVGSTGRVSLSRYLANPELVKMVLAATTESGETDTAKWMTAGSAQD